ncbi:gluconate 2-dehydrogenase subunit 3 family protein [Bradyrhizobium sp. SSUT18]|uniref:gluconate 2-dehydrogenase subunit 3 family protein n=1 Tax=unclassified Bradyrhizobium TaxID=2631580 RepID=UPI002449351A|nr:MULTISPECIES: gluconate 2-dehydrogenase subunit 3 family protein [unclassified Bradyrhizobium]MDH2343590.1 gluconate 2-dehydrogenase subunit 3 family protein [Bradyrhizobium sp. SSUT77]MDH2352310.1 gluconate 2-dehydrogenase subunit 3 family protein [Bradyrhizobium sp. SSUT112]MDH2400936.1 gluconate 2-dehydrogenase subunit 3 family protein [Bradyrhizobium sp. SSUT18]
MVDIARRDVLTMAGAVGVGVAIPVSPAPAEVPPKDKAQDSPAASAAARSYQFFDLNEVAFIEAFVDHMIPADELTPSGVELGITIYIDRQLAGAWGRGARMYLLGPWAAGTSQQGYQLPLAPADFYRCAIRAVEAHCVAVHGGSFDRLQPAQRQQIVQALSEGSLHLQEVPAQAFFDMAYANVMEGLFADPIYGGNKDKRGWKLVGFPGVIAAHAENIERFRGKPYPVEPLGIADLS